MTVIHKKCNAKVVTTHPETGEHTSGDWGWCSKCGERIDHLIHLGNGVPGISDQVQVIWD